VGFLDKLNGNYESDSFALLRRGSQLAISINPVLHSLQFSTVVSPVTVTDLQTETDVETFTILSTSLSTAFASVTRVSTEFDTTSTKYCHLRRDRYRNCSRTSHSAVYKHQRGSCGCDCYRQ
jgi:hypothetical protein